MVGQIGGERPAAQSIDLAAKLAVALSKRGQAAMTIVTLITNTTKRSTPGPPVYEIDDRLTW